MSTGNLSNDAYWLVLQDGRMGTDGQSIGLVEAMGKPHIKYNLKLSWWQRLLPPRWASKFVAAELAQSFNQRPPVGIIGAGRRAAYGLLAAKRLWPHIQTVQIQNPKVNPLAFDVVIAPQHDALVGANVIQTLGGLHNLTDDKLAAASVHWQSRLAAFPSPRVAVLIGGNNKHFVLTEKWMDDLSVQLKKLHASGHVLWITISRRTPPVLAARLQNQLSAENIFFWDGQGDNPYHAFLARADFILVTSDSVSMISESLFTDKPVALLRMPGHSTKFDRFYHALIAQGYTNWFNGSWSILQRPRLRETQRVAALIGK
ncbi:MAG TPA: mitochondrial fission ELM1 family protein [Alphaproteobacteria bacterium]|mgnify:CR=1 FL=1|nr:hypothetical protein [Rhodospirillaceae bacterium]HRJ12562.1 mitochondrial fission ELM1 family protein [Alphaproteobacteria bacterium]